MKVYGVFLILLVFLVGYGECGHAFSSVADDSMVRVPSGGLSCVEGHLYATCDGYMLRLQSAQELADGDFACRLDSEWEVPRCPNGHLMRSPWSGGCIVPGCPYWEGRGP